MSLGILVLYHIQRYWCINIKQLRVYLIINFSIYMYDINVKC